MKELQSSIIYDFLLDNYLKRFTLNSYDMITALHWIRMKITHYKDKINSLKWIENYQINIE